jgi:hypothetical protein
MVNINSRPINQAGSPPKKVVDGRPSVDASNTRIPPSISIALTDKAFASIEREAKARGITAERLALAALADFLGRNAKTGPGRNQPLVLHFPGRLRGLIVKTAQADGVSVNRFVVRALAERLDFELQPAAVSSVDASNTRIDAPAGTRP